MSEINRSYTKDDVVDKLNNKKNGSNKTFTLNRSVACNLLISILLAIISAGLGALVWVLAGKQDGRLTDYVVPLLMIGTTVGGIVCARNEKISSVSENDIIAQFFLALFSFLIASVVNIDSIKNISKEVFVVFSIITVSTFLLHMLLCKIFKIDIKLMIVTSTAGIYGPAFIPGVCTALNEKVLVPVGLIMGSLGYVIGTFLGCALTMLLKGGF